MENRKNYKGSKVTHRPLIYVVSINWNGLYDTLVMLSSLKKCVNLNIKIVIIDNGSKKNEARIIKGRYPDICLIKNKNNVGYCKANNQGMKIALKNKAKYVLLLNNDTVVKTDFLTKLVEYAEKNNFNGILTPKILYYKKGVIWAFGGKISKLTSIPKMIWQGKPSKKYLSVVEPDYAPGCAFFVNSSILKKIGFFDETYFAYYEDTDLSYRIKKAGYRIVAIPKSIVWHKVSRSTNQYTTDKINEIQSYYLARNGIIFGINNLNGFQMVMYLTQQLLLKFPAYLLLKCNGVDARRQYSKGIFDGIKYAINKKPVLEKSTSL